jgi:hypothetical protein
LFFVNYKKGALNSQPQVIKFTSCSTTKTGRHDIAEILLKVALKHQKNQSKSTNKENVQFVIVFIIVES